MSSRKKIYVVQVILLLIRERCCLLKFVKMGIEHEHSCVAFILQIPALKLFH